jgi:hypothetical protein
LTLLDVSRDSAIFSSCSRLGVKKDENDAVWVQTCKQYNKMKKILKISGYFPIKIEIYCTVYNLSPLFICGNEYGRAYMS